MANTIVSQSSELAVEMNNSRFARAPVPDTFDGWNSLRIAMHVMVVDPGTNIAGSPIFRFGLCTGNTNIPGDTSVTHFVGMTSVAATWTRTVLLTAGTYRFTSASNFSYQTIVGASTVSTTGGAGSYGLTSFPSLLFLNIVRSGANWNMQGWGVSANQATEMSADTYLGLVYQGALPSVTGYSYFTAGNVAMTEPSAGLLDHVCVQWNQTLTGIRILDLRVIRFS